MASKLLVARDLVAGNPRTFEDEQSAAVARASVRGRTVIADPRALVAYVNDGRWVADCPHCRTGIALDPAWPGGCCWGTGCYRTFSAVIWPDDRIEIEEALVGRPLMNQHWGFARGVALDASKPAETVADLQLENERFLTPLAEGEV